MTPRKSFAGELAAACWGALLSFIVVAMAGPLVPLMALDLGASPATLGLLISVANVGALLAAVPSGWVIGRTGSRIPMVAATIVIAGSCLFIHLSPTLPSLFVGLVFFGIGRTVSAVAIQCYVGGLRGTTDASVNFGWYGTAVAVGQMLGPLMAGLAMDSLGKPQTWLIMAGLSTVTAAWLLVLIRKEEPANSVANETRESATRSLRSRIAGLVNATTIVGILSSFSIIFALGARTSFYPVFLKGLGYSAALIGAMIAVRGFVAMLARMSIGPALRALGGRVRLLYLCLVILALGIGMTPLCRSIPMIVANSIIIGIGFGVAMPLSQAVVFDGAGAERRSVAMGVRMTGNRLAQMSSPLLFGYVIEWYTMAVAFVAGGILLFLASVPLLRWTMTEGRRDSPNQ
jgi:MFS family permease